MAQVRKLLSRRVIAQLGRRGFTVTDTAITGGDDGTLAKLLPGGKSTIRRLRKLSIRA